MTGAIVKTSHVDPVIRVLHGTREIGPRTFLVTAIYGVVIASR